MNIAVINPFEEVLMAVFYSKIELAFLLLNKAIKMPSEVFKKAQEKITKRNKSNLKWEYHI